MREDLTFENHRIIADDSAGKALAQIYIGERLVGERLEAETLDGVISAAKRWISDRLTEDRSRQRAPNIATRERYVEFIGTQPLSEHERTMLVEHARKGVMTAGQIAHTARWENYSSANTHYGYLGRRIAEFLGLAPVERDNGEAIWTTAIAGDLGRGGDPKTSHFEWQMHDELAEALVDAGYLSARPAWLDDKSLLVRDTALPPLSPSVRIKLTGGNIRNRHIYLKDHLDIFPPDAIGGSDKSQAAAKRLTLDFEHGESVETDIDGADKKIFRDRSVVRRFFEASLMRAGDEVEIENTGPYRYTIRRLPQRRPEPLSDEALHDRLASDNPRVWVTSFWGFLPERWGCVGFTDRSALDRFLNEAGPDPLMVIYGSKSSKTDFKYQEGKVLGLYALSDLIGAAEEFVDPLILRRGRDTAESEDSWEHSVKATRAWAIPSEDAPTIDDFADETYTPAKGRAIGRFGAALTPAEARKLLNLPMEERSVYGGTQVDTQTTETLSKRLKPAKAGPIPKRGWSVEPPDGLKHLYVLKLSGDPAPFLTDTLAVEAGQNIYKVGMSKHPTKRKDDINRNYPQGAYLWQLQRSTFLEQFEPLDAQTRTVKGEDAMKDFLELKGESLGGEFFLADDKLILEAWALGKSKAQFGDADE